jgi:hypothetical protein
MFLLCIDGQWYFMNRAAVRKWALFFCGILLAIVIADTLSNVLLSFAGLNGGIRFLVGFILYALLFFTVLYLIERASGITFIGFSRRLE